MKKKDLQLRERLLNIACEIAENEGIEQINIRSIAARAGVASGTVYNYFSGKEEILLGITERYWEKAFEEMKGRIKADDFCGEIREIFLFLREKLRQAGKLMSSLDGNFRKVGEGKMANAQSRLGDYLRELLDKDKKISPKIWQGNFTKEKFGEFVMENIVSGLKTGKNDIDFLILTVRKIIY